MCFKKSLSIITREGIKRHCLKLIELEDLRIFFKDSTKETNEELTITMLKMRRGRRE